MKKYKLNTYIYVDRRRLSVILLLSSVPEIPASLTPNIQQSCRTEFLLIDEHDRDLGLRKCSRLICCDPFDHWNLAKL